MFCRVRVSLWFWMSDRRFFVVHQIKVTSRASIAFQIISFSFQMTAHKYTTENKSQTFFFCSEKKWKIPVCVLSS